MKFPRVVLLALVPALVSAAEFTARLTSTKGEKVVEAVVSLIPLDAPVPPVAAGARVEIAQQGQEFSAYVTVVQSGTRVVFPNRDTVQHHVYSLSKAKKFELPLYNPGEKESVAFEVSGLVTIGCNIHDWMISHLLVVPTPYFAKSDEQGLARVAAPAGRYRLEIWHPRAPTPVTKEVALTDAGAAEAFALTLKPDRRVRRSLGGKTNGY
jgi:plastocyanin